MKTLTIIENEEQNLISLYLTAFHENLAQWNVHLESLSFPTTSQNLTPFLENSIYILLEISPDPSSFQQSLKILNQTDNEKKIILMGQKSTFSSHDWKTILNLCQNSSQIFHFIDIEQDAALSLPFFRQLLKNEKYESEKSMDIELLLELKNELEQITVSVESELSKVKKLHENFVPKRFSEIKGVHIQSKYAVGKHPGGEFFDLLYKQKYLGLFLSSGLTYNVSNLILSHFTHFKKETHIDLKIIGHFITHLSHEIQKIHQIQNIQLFLAILDLKSLTLEGYNFGQTLLMSSHGQMVPTNDHLLQENFKEKSFFQLRLSRGEKVILVSPGLRKNTNDTINNESLTHFLKKHFDQKPIEILNELFFQLKKDKNNDFLPFDASSLIIEVNKNVLIEV